CNPLCSLIPPFHIIYNLHFSPAALAFGSDQDYQIDIIHELDLANATYGITQVAGLHNSSKAFLFREKMRQPSSTISASLHMLGDIGDDGTDGNLLIPRSALRKAEPLPLISAITLMSTVIITENVGRAVHAPAHITEKVMQLFRSKSEFTFLASIQQKSSTSGVIFSIHESEHSYFELESSGVREEIRYHYRYKGKPRSESFPYRLADGQWHKIALTISASHLLLHVDCNRLALPMQHLAFHYKDYDLCMIASYP
ncbi:hypothetical protein L3Q82_008561, partial [Scortum barcoo]